MFLFMPDGKSRNSKIPIKKTQKYTTAQDNQEQVHIKVYQGERSKAIQN